MAERVTAHSASEHVWMYRQKDRQRVCVCELGRTITRMHTRERKRALCCRDVSPLLLLLQGSTELWEWDSPLASEAFKLHDRVLRQYMTQVWAHAVYAHADTGADAAVAACISCFMQCALST